jgi:hypothetical protein
VVFDSEELHLFEPGRLKVAPHIAEEIPDAGVFFLAWATQGLRPDQAREIESAVNGRRCTNGWFPIGSLSGIALRGFRPGPLTYLARMTAEDPEILRRWATRALPDHGRTGEAKRRIDDTSNHLLLTQGHAAAATWVVAVRPQAFLDVGMLGDKLYATWDAYLSSLRPKDMVRAVRRWNR